MHQSGDMARMQRRRCDHQPIRGLDAPAGKNEFARHETMPLMAASKKHFGDFFRTIDENERRRIPRFSIWKALVANGSGQPFGPIGRYSTFDYRIRSICAHQHLLSKAARR